MNEIIEYPKYVAADGVASAIVQSADEEAAYFEAAKAKADAEAKAKK